MTQTALQATHPSQFAHMDHFDLLMSIWHSRTTHQIALHKVKAHHPDRRSLPPLMQYWTLGNECADQAAQAACRQALPQVVKDLEQQHAAVSTLQHQLEELYKLHLQLYHDRKLSEAAPEPEPTEQTPDICAAFASWAPAPLQAFDLPDHHAFFEHSQWGEDTSFQLREWTRTLQWPADHTAGGPLQAEGISWTELALSYMLHTQRYLPVQRQDASGDTRILIPGSDASLIEHKVTLADLTATMSQVFDHTQSLMTTALTPLVSRKKHNSLYIQGFRRWVSGWSTRPIISQQAAVARIIYEGFRRHSNDFLQTVPSLELEVREDILLPGTLEERRLAARAMQTQARRLKRQG
eukprot:Skav203968  [mRNA]  locus=scaffold94:389012:390067:- [translate_table: standard]